MEKNINELVLKSTSKFETENNDHYPEFAKSIQDQFDAVVKENTKLFTTNVDGLFDIFLNNIPESSRQHYICRACRKFVDDYGGLVVINSDGSIEPVMWKEEVPELFNKSVQEIRIAIKKSKVTGVFISNYRTLGQPNTGIWNHMSVQINNNILTSRLQTPYQYMAEKTEDFKMLIDSLELYDIQTIKTAVLLLKTDSLYRSEKCLGIAEWFMKLYLSISDVKNINKKINIIWKAVSEAPIGFCHIRSSMIGTLLDDIKSGLSEKEIGRRFKEKMNPTQYQRPQVGPNVGNILQAEKIIKELGLERSLHRRFAKLEELNLIWKPKKEEELKDKSGVFSHLLPKKDTIGKYTVMNSITITWDKFYRIILPDAINIEFANTALTKVSYGAIVTAKYDDAPPIIRWDKLEQRNPFSYYMYYKGSSSAEWNLTDDYIQVTGICYDPAAWYSDTASKNIFFILKGAKDLKYKQGCGNALFPETLIPELREIRSTIEKFSQNEVFDNIDESSACGIILQNSFLIPIYKFRVTTDLGTAIYVIDRID